MQGGEILQVLSAERRDSETAYFCLETIESLEEKALVMLPAEKTLHMETEVKWETKVRKEIWLQ